jgi:universal stress protein A
MQQHSRVLFLSCFLPEGMGMVFFKKPLLAIDLGPEVDILLSRVSAIYRHNIEKITIVHVIRPNQEPSSQSGLELRQSSGSQQLYDQAIVKINAVLLRNGFRLPRDRIVILSGEPASEIKKLAQEIKADLVIVGSHSKSDSWLDVPGATTNCVLQGIHSDVMAVRICSSPLLP